MISKLKPKSEFSRNVLTLMTGTTIAQAIPIAISPILTRLYTPEDFGVFALYVAVFSVFGSVANAKYELAIMLPKKDEDAINVMALGFIINIILTLFLLLMVIVFHDNFLNLLGNKDISPWLYFIPVSVFLTGCFNLLNYFNNRLKYYKDLAKVNVAKSIAMAIVQFSMGFLKFGAMGLISGQIVSQIVSNTKLLFNIKKLNLFIKIKKVKIIALAKRYKDFPKYKTPSSILDIFTLQTPYIFLPQLFNLSMSGSYFFANRIISIPSGLIATSISQVYFQKISKYYQKNEIYTFFKNTTIKLFSISIILALIIYFLSPIMFDIIFGNKWKLSGEIASLLSVIFFVRFIVSPISVTLILEKYIKLGVLWQVIYFITTSMVFLVSYYIKLNFFQFLELYIIHEIVLYTLYFIFIFYAIKDHDRKVLLKCAE